MSRPNPTDYLETHLYNELRWLLCAATEWHVQQSIQLGIAGHYVQVYAMDSVVLHARALFEFLSQPQTRNHLSVNLYGLLPIPSALYRDSWRGPLHSYLMHAQDRVGAQQLTSFDRQTVKDLNRMPVDFAYEIVRLWRAFIGGLQNQGNSLATLAQAVLDDAIRESALVVTNEVNSRHGINPIAW